ncbi:hypothetical protein F7725_012770, partial [Dissostichus mawsoni]
MDQEVPGQARSQQGPDQLLLKGGQTARLGLGPLLYPLFHCSDALPRCRHANKHCSHVHCHAQTQAALGLIILTCKTLTFSACITLYHSQVQPISTFLCGAPVTPPHPWEDGIILYLEGLHRKRCFLAASSCILLARCRDEGATAAAPIDWRRRSLSQPASGPLPSLSPRAKPAPSSLTHSPPVLPHGSARTHAGSTYAQHTDTQWRRKGARAACPARTPPTTPEGLKEYFCKYGEVKECMVMRDPVTKRSRGFGFVTFVDQAGVDKVLAQTRHELDSKTIDPKVAFPRRAQPKLVTRTKKIFVGGLSVNTTIEDVKQYFDQFGKVDDAMLMFDKTTNRHREALISVFVWKQVECKKAQPKEVMSPTGSARGRSRVMPYGMDAFMLGIGMLGYPGFQTATYTSRSYAGITPGYTFQYPEFHLERTPLLTSPHPPELTGSTPSRTAGFLGTSSPGPMADLYGSGQESAVSSYLSAASPAPNAGFGHGL